MTFRVEITPIAPTQIEGAYQWYRLSNPEFADRWFRTLMNKIATLQVQPRRCALAVEHEIFPEEVRQLLHGGAKMSIESYLRFDTIPSPFSMSATALKHL